MWDVARPRGGSLKTVSRVVNDEAGVGTATAARVRRAIDSLGYRPNDMARNLRRQRSSSIGLIIEDIRNPFYSAIARAVEEVAQASKHLVIVGSSNEDPVAERRLVGTLLERRNGVLLLVPAGSDPAYLDGELGFGLPVVFIDRPPGNIEADTILIDNAGGARMGGGHLVGQGHGRSGVVGDPLTIYTIAERVAGFRKALAEAGAPLDETLLRLG